MMGDTAAKAGVTKKTAEAVVDAYIKVIMNELKYCGKARINGLGMLETKERPERNVRNPKTGEMMTASKTTAVKFRLSEPVRVMLNDGSCDNLR